jgi:hypothetical protein
VSKKQYDLTDPISLPLELKAWIIAYVTQELQLQRVPGYKPVFTAPGVIFQSGTGSPESVLAAPVGSLYTRVNGGANTTLYVKESGSGTTGWIAK